MAADEIEAAVGILEKYLHSTFVLAKAEIFTDTARPVGCGDGIDLDCFGFVNIANHGHFPLGGESHTP